MFKSYTDLIWILELIIEFKEGACHTHHVCDLNFEFCVRVCVYVRMWGVGVGGGCLNVIEYNRQKVKNSIGYK